MQYAGQIVILLTALVGLATAIFAYRSSRLKQISSPSESKVKLIRIDSEPISKWKWRFLQAWFLLLFLLTLYSSVTMPGTILVSVVSLAVATPFWFYAFWKIFRRRPWEEHSLVQRKTSVEVQGDYDSVFSQCDIALRKIGARIISVDRRAGVIKARKQSSVWSLGTKLDVGIEPGGAESYIVTVQADSVLPTVVWDMGITRRRVERFIEHLVS